MNKREWLLKMLLLFIGSGILLNAAIFLSTHAGDWGEFLLYCLMAFHVLLSCVAAKNRLSPGSFVFNYWVDIALLSAFFLVGPIFWLIEWRKKHCH
jgi:hypothetical protein